jgi:hypothetical protein
MHKVDETFKPSTVTATNLQIHPYFLVMSRRDLAEVL